MLYTWVSYILRWILNYNFKFNHYHFYLTSTNTSCVLGSVYVCYTFTRWLTTLHKIILAHHDENCECDCGFCVSCGDLDSLSIGGFMRLMLCPPSLRFHGSTIPLFDWNCIDDKYVCFLSLFRVFNFYSYWTAFCFLCLSCSTVATSVTLTSLRVFSNAQYHACCTTKGR